MNVISFDFTSFRFHFRFHFHFIFIFIFISFRFFYFIYFMSFHSFIASLIRSLTHSIQFSLTQFNSIQFNSIQLNSTQFISIQFSRFNSLKILSSSRNISHKQTGSHSHVLFLKLPPRRVPGTTW